MGRLLCLEQESNFQTLHGHCQYKQKMVQELMESHWTANATKEETEIMQLSAITFAI